ncbi:hypothetical protein VPHK251G3_0074 [Vibrio phage K251 g3]
MTESKTPIADKVRKLELELNAAKETRETAEEYLEAISADDYPQDRFPVNHPMLHVPNMWVDRVSYIGLLKAHIKFLNEEMGNLESKLTTVYAALNDCLSDGDK